MPNAPASGPVSSAQHRAASAAMSGAAGSDLIYRTLARDIDGRREWMSAFRRRLHAMPEPSGAETATTALVAETLQKAGLPHRILQGGLGIIAELELGASASFVALRSELDSVGVDDEKQSPYASTRIGQCHACGHDAHTTMNLAAALTLHEHRDELRRLKFRHNIRFIFQPAEETAAGARSVIEQGAIDGVQAIFAQHVEPFLDAGQIGIRRGPMTAACKTFRITLRGHGGHSARPHQATDPIAAAMLLINQLYALCPRSIDGRQPLALTVGSIHAGQAANVIPDTCELSGTVRTMRLEDTEIIDQRVQAIIEGVATSTGCTIEIEYLHFCPQTDNDSAVVDLVLAAANEVVGPSNVQWIELPSMGGEDFAFYQQRIPGAFVRLGAGLGKGQTRRALHSSLFDIDEACLPIGAKLMMQTGLKLAQQFEPRRT